MSERRAQGLAEVGPTNIMAAMNRNPTPFFPLFPLAVLALVVLIGTGVAPPALADGIQRLGEFGDWSAFQFNEGDKTGCYVASEPKKAVGDYKKRGDIYALVTHRPGEKRRDEVSFVAGYSYETDSVVEVTIGEKAFKLFTLDDGAWNPDTASDKAMVQAMIRGKSMTVKGTSARGTPTTDTYSLGGFTKAYNAIDKACGAQ
jgi:hypothetical protein